MHKHGADIGKIMALKDAGWRNEKIAGEMHMEPDAVEEIISKYTERKECAPKEIEEVEPAENEQLSIILTYGQLQELSEKAAAVGAREALKTFEKERKKEFSKRSMYDNEVIIDSIKRSATRTAVIVSHIETMLGFYAVYCEKSMKSKIEMRRYEVLWDMYMAEEPLSVKEIAEKQHISQDTIYSDLKIATEYLSALIFGVDGLRVQ